MKKSEAEKKADHALKNGFESAVFVHCMRDFAERLTPIQRRDVTLLVSNMVAADESIEIACFRQFRKSFLGVN